jgi:hypothetical protein
MKLIVLIILFSPVNAVGTSSYENWSVEKWYRLILEGRLVFRQGTIDGYWFHFSRYDRWNEIEEGFSMISDQKKSLLAAQLGILREILHAERMAYEEDLLNNALIKFNDSIGSASLGIVQKTPFEIERNLLLDINKNLYDSTLERKIILAKMRKKTINLEDLERLLIEGNKEPLEKIYFKGAIRSWIDFLHSFRYYFGDTGELAKMEFKDLLRLYIQLLKPMNIILDHRYSFYFLQSSWNLLTYLRYLVFLEPKKYINQQRNCLNREWDQFLDTTYGFLTSTYQECSIIFQKDLDVFPIKTSVSSVEMWMIPTVLPKTSFGFYSSYLVERFQNGDLKLYYRDTPITGMVVLVISVSACYPNILKENVQVDLVNKVIKTLQSEYSITK